MLRFFVANQLIDFELQGDLSLQELRALIQSECLGLATFEDWETSEQLLIVFNF